MEFLLVGFGGVSVALSVACVDPAVEPEPAPEPAPEPGASIRVFPQTVRSAPWHQHFDTAARNPEPPAAIVWPSESDEHPQG
jgi:hypothetical protein